MLGSIIEEYEELCSEFNVHEVTFHYVDSGEDFSETSTNVKQSLYDMINTYNEKGVCFYNELLTLYDVTFIVS